MASISNKSGSESNYFFGWDLLFKSVEKDIHQNSDVLIALTHFTLLRQYNMRNVGIGEDKTLSDDDVRSELLPTGWNVDSDKYTLRYAHDKKLYLLFGHKSGDLLIINLLDVATKDVSNIALDPSALVKEHSGTIYQLVPNASEIVDRLRKELVEPVFTGTTRAVTTQTATTSSSTREDYDPLRVGEPRRPIRPFVPSGIDVRPFGFPEVGRGDLDPLGRAGPGNLLVFPSRPDFHGSNNGMQPRFDPYGPPGGNMRGNPNPDHLPPPNIGDDFYM